MLHLAFTAPRHDEPVRLCIRQRPKQNCIDNAEDRSVRPDAQRQRDDGNRREARALHEISCRVTNLTQDKIHGYSLIKISVSIRTPSACYSPFRLSTPEACVPHSYLSATIGSTFVARRAGR